VCSARSRAKANGSNRLLIDEISSVSRNKLLLPLLLLHKPHSSSGHKKEFAAGGILHLIKAIE
jgi:hypothetical protein